MYKTHVLWFRSLIVASAVLAATFLAGCGSLQTYRVYPKSDVVEAQLPSNKVAIFYYPGFVQYASGSGFSLYLIDGRLPSGQEPDEEFDRYFEMLKDSSPTSDYLPEPICNTKKCMLYQLKKTPHLVYKFSAGFLGNGPFRVDLLPGKHAFHFLGFANNTESTRDGNLITRRYTRKICPLIKTEAKLEAGKVYTVKRSFSLLTGLGQKTGAESGEICEFDIREANAKEIKKWGIK
ncbi:MAG TPA: hypothetical protein DCL44_04545 [Elusimicrobia bacterium]|nr:hypothetical protein [Elusimicrobiota bacterium]